MTGRCPGSGTVVPKELRGDGPPVAVCPLCQRVITVSKTRANNFEPAYRQHVTSPAPTVFNPRPRPPAVSP